jgi:DNA repair ATPase RecN
MKTQLIALAFAITFAAGRPALAADKQDKALHNALNRIQENCRLVDEYAPIYEWNNVNKEVDRIVAAQHKIDQAMKADAGHKAQVEALDAAVKELRSARLNQNPDRAVAAADKVKAAVDQLGL